MIKTVLQGRHGRFLGFHFLILDLHSGSDIVCFKSNGNVLQHFGSK